MIDQNESYLPYHGTQTVQYTGEKDMDDRMIMGEGGGGIRVGLGIGVRIWMVWEL